MIRLIKVCFWIAVVVMFLPEDVTSDKTNKGLTTTGAIELANSSIKNVSNFCVDNPGACLQSKDALVGISQKTISTARTIYDYIQETSTDDVQNGIEQVLTTSDMLSIEEQIKVAQTTGQTLSVADLNIDFSNADVQ